MKEILCFGDSNTFGLVPGTKERYPFDKRWTGILQKNLFQKDYLFIEEGLCGRTTMFEDELRNFRKGSELLPTLLESHSSISKVILMLGTNDCKSYYNASAEVIGLGIEKLIDQIKRFNAKIEILLVSPILLGEEIWKNEYDPEFNEQSIKTSKKLKNVYEKIAQKYKLDFIAASDIATASNIDQEHLDEIGHKKLANALIDKLII